MNLYRSFGNLLETWVTEGLPQQDEWLCSECGNSTTPSPDMGMNLRSESEDSGVETASTDMSLTSPCCSAPAGNTEIDPVTTEREEDRLTPASTSQSSVISVPSSASSSSQSLSPKKDQKSGCLKVEQALYRSQPRWQSLRNDPESGTDDVVLRRRTHTSSLPKQQASTLVTGQRSESFGLRTTGGPLSRQTSEPCRRALPLYRNTLPAQTEAEGDGDKELGPGLSYLEQVCRMLEEIARLQKRNTVLQMEMDALQEHQAKQASKVKYDIQAPETLQCDHKVAEEEVFSSCQRLEPRWQNYNAQHDFRQRSASDTSILTGHSIAGQLKPDSRGQHGSTNELFEKAEDHEKQEMKKVENKTKSWKIKIGSLGRHETGLKSGSEINSQQMHSSQKKNRRQLSQLFRRRRKTLPA